MQYTSKYDTTREEDELTLDELSEKFQVTRHLLKIAAYSGKVPSRAIILNGRTMVVCRINDVKKYLISKKKMYGEF